MSESELENTRLDKTIYVISPFRLQESLNNWKVFYAEEIFSVFALIGKRVVWIQPGRKFSFTIFPHFKRVWRFTVVELGNYFLFRYLLGMFISRLIKVTKEQKPLLFFELVNKTPLNLDMGPEILLFPIVFDLSEKWKIYDTPPTPVFVVENRDNKRFGSFQNNPQIVFLPWGCWEKPKEPSKNWSFCVQEGESVPELLFVSNCNAEIKELVKKKEIFVKNISGKRNPLLSFINLNDFQFEEKILISDFFAYLTKKGKECKVVLGKELGYLAYQLLFLGAGVFVLAKDLVNLNFFPEDNSIYVNGDENYRLLLPRGNMDWFSESMNGRKVISWDNVVTNIIEPAVISVFRNAK